MLVDTVNNTQELRPLRRSDAAAALGLYTELTLGPRTQSPEAFYAVLDHPGTSVFGVFNEAKLAAMVTLHLLPNVTWDARPYGLIENVITQKSQRRQGYGRAVLSHAIAQAWAADAYKVMLMTGQKRGAQGFYHAVGFSSEDKHAMVIRRS